MDGLFFMFLIIIVLGFCEYSKAQKPIPLREALLGAAFMLMWAIGEKHGQNYLLLFCSVVSTILGCSSALGRPITGTTHPDAEIAAQLRRKETVFFLSIGGLGLVVLLGMEHFPKSFTLLLYGLMVAVILINAYCNRRLNNRIKQWEMAQAMTGPAELPTDAEVRKVNRSIVRAFLILAISIGISIWYVKF